MKIVLYTSLLLLWFVGSSTTSIPPVGPDYNGDGCFLPPPGGIQLVEITPASLTYKWNPREGAAMYRISVYEGPSSKMIKNVLIAALPSNNQYKITGLTPGSAYSVNIYTVCANGMENQ